MVKVEAQKRPIESVKVDVLCHAIGGHCNLSAGPVAECISKSAGPGLQAEVYRKRPGSSLSLWATITTDAHNLEHARKVYHTNCDFYHEDNEKQSFEKMNEAIKENIMRVGRDGLKSIAFSFLGTGILGYPCEKMAKTFLRAIQEVHGVVRGLEKVILVTIHDNAMEILQGIAEWCNPTVRRLCAGSEEYKAATKEFKNHPEFEIVQVEKISSRYRELLFDTRKKAVTKEMITKDPVSRRMVHGTSDDAAKSIAATGFNPKHKTINATLHGKGTYFDNTTDMMWATGNDYSTKSKSLSEKKLLVAEVITGNSLLGNPEMTEDDLIHHEVQSLLRKLCGSRPTVYHSSCNDRKSIFVIYETFNAVPLYVVTFKHVDENNAVEKTVPASKPAVAATDNRTANANQESCVIL